MTYIYIYMCMDTDLGWANGPGPKGTADGQPVNDCKRKAILQPVFSTGWPAITSLRIRLAQARSPRRDLPGKVS